MMDINLNIIRCDFMVMQNERCIFNLLFKADIQVGNTAYSCKT